MGKVLGISAPKPQPVQLPDPLPPVPERSSSETAALADEQRRRLVEPRGRASTFLTAGGTDSASSAVRFLGASART